MADVVLPFLLAQVEGGELPPGVLLFLLILFLLWLAVTVIVIAGFWKMFAKAGQPGWACIVPIYNLYIWCVMVGRPAWWIILCFIPLLNVVPIFILCLDLAKSFGKDNVYGVGIFFLYPIFIPILGFGSAEYTGPSAAEEAVG